MQICLKNFSVKLKRYILTDTIQIQNVNWSFNNTSFCYSWIGNIKGNFNKSLSFYLKFLFLQEKSFLNVDAIASEFPAAAAFEKSATIFSAPVEILATSKATTFATIVTMFPHFFGNFSNTLALTT